MNSVLYGTALKKVWMNGVKDYGYYDEKNPEKGGMENFDVNDMTTYLSISLHRDESMVKELHRVFTLSTLRIW